MTKLTQDDKDALANIGISCESLDESLEDNPILACNYKLLYVAKYGCEGLLWLVEQDRITLDKAYRTALRAEGWEQIDLLQGEFLETGAVEGMGNRNDVFVIPDELTITTIDKVVKE